jgi:hypothetical protein
VAPVSSTLISNRRFPVGTTTSALWQIPAGATLARVTIDPNVGDFDDPALRITFKIALSADQGVTFPVSISADIVGGARTKGGGFPFIEVPLRIVRPPYDGSTDTVFNSAVASMTLNIATRLGLILTTDAP